MAYYHHAQNPQAMYADATATATATATARAFPPSQQLPQQYYPDAHPRAQIPLQLPQQSHGYPHAQLPQPPYGPYSGDAMSMPPPPSTVATPMTGATMQLGISQRPPSAPYQSHMQNNQQNPSAYLPSQANFSAPPTTQAFYSQPNPPIPSPTRSQTPSSNSISSAKPAMAAAVARNPSPQHQQQQQPAQTQQRPPSSSSQKPILQPPLSPKSAAIETQRVTALLEINRVLLYEMTQLQAAGRFGPLFGQPQQGGQASPTAADGDGGTKKDGGETKDGGANANGETTAKAKGPVQALEYVACMRRLQSNLAYLAYAADRSHKPVEQFPRFPAIMEPPPPTPGNMISEEGMRDLEGKYAGLKELFPDYKGVGGKEKEGGSAGAGGGQGNGVGGA